MSRRRRIVMRGGAGGAGPSAFYVAAAGSDSNDGLSPATAWQTIAKVNAAVFIAGDSVRFKGGETFAGDLVLSVPHFSVTSYGTGKATIDATGANAIYFKNKGGISITNINTVGDIYCSVDEVSSNRFVGLTITGVDLTTGGIIIGKDVTGGTAGFDDILIENCTSDGSLDAGIGSYLFDNLSRPFNNMIVRSCTVTGAARSGIVLGGVNGGLVELSTASGNGVTGDAGGGIWAYGCTDVIIRNNIAHNNSAASVDGFGFDLDGDCINCLLEYNLSYNNFGPGYFVCTYPAAPSSGSVVRYNISIDDGSTASAGIYQAGIMIATQGGMANTGLAVYNNTVYQSRAGRYAFRTSTGNNTGRVANNIFYTAGSAGGWINDNAQNPALTFNGNDYFGVGDIKWNSSTYTTPALWRAGVAAQETLSGSPTWHAVDPKLVNAGSTVAADYKLLNTSTLIGAGLDLSAAFGISVGVLDYFGNPVPTGGTFEIGAYEGVGIAPSYTWPATGVLDNFNRADGGLGANWAEAVDFYDEGSRLFGIVSNQAYNPSGNYYGAWYWTAATYGPNVEAYLTITAVPMVGEEGPRVFVRMQDVPDVGNNYKAYSFATNDTGGWTLVAKLAGGVENVLASGSLALGVGDKLGISAIGTTIKAWSKPAAGSWTAIATVTDSSITGVGNVGFYLGTNYGVGASCRIDDFSGGTV